MKPLVPLLFCLLLVTAGPLAAETVRIGTWNVRNYLLQNRWHDGKFRFEYPKPETEKMAVRRVIQSVAPDILLLQELGSAELLEELREDLAAAGTHYPFSHLSIREGSRTGLAILATVEPTEIIFHDPLNAKDGSLLLQRGIQEVLFELPNASLRVFHVHLKSRYTTDAADPDSINYRTAELKIFARLAKERLLASGESDEIVVLAGDFNAPFEAPMLSGLREDWRPLPVMDSTGENWTYHHYKSGRKEQIDGFWQANDTPGLFSPIAVLPTSEETLRGSDHRLVIINWQASAIKGSQPAPRPNP